MAQHTRAGTLTMPSLLYDQHVEWWELLSRAEDHGREVWQALGLMKRWLPRRAGGRLTLLELGSGAGLGTMHLAQRFDVTAVDRSAAMLRLSRRRNPAVRHVRADMRRLNLRQRFDVVLCYDAIDHVTTAADAARVASMIGRHLLPGGVCLIAPAYLSDTFVSGAMVSDVASDPARALEVAYVSRVSAAPQPQRYDWTVTLIVRDRGMLSLHEERQRCGLFAAEQWARWLEQAGLRVVRRPSGSRGLGAIVAVRAGGGAGSR